MSIIYSTALPDDHKKILQIAKQSKYTKDFGSMMFSSPEAYAKGWIRVALRGLDIVGFTCVRHKVRAPETVLYFITVDESARSQGVGWQLIEEAMASGPHKVMTLNVSKTNTRALEFYLRHGFKVVGEAIEGTAHAMRKEF